MPAALPLLGSTGSTTFVLAALLVGLGLVMIGAAVWLVKATRTDVPALGPLEVVGDRRFARRDAEAQAAALAAARPEGAIGPAPMVEIEDVAPDPSLPEDADESDESDEPPEPAATVADVDVGTSEPEETVERAETAETAPQAS